MDEHGQLLKFCMPPGGMPLDLLVEVLSLVEWMHGYAKWLDGNDRTDAAQAVAALGTMLADEIERLPNRLKAGEN